MRTLANLEKEEIKTTSDLTEMYGYFLAENLYNEWEEDFINEDTGEVVKIQRRETLEPKGTFLDKTTLQRIDFYLQSKQISQVKVTNIPRVGYEKETLQSPWQVTASINEKRENYMLHAQSVTEAISLTKEYLEIQGKYAFEIVGTKKLKNEILISCEDVVAERDKLLQKKKWHNILFSVQIDDNELEFTCIVFCENPEEAKSECECFIKEKFHIKEIMLTIKSAKQIPLESIIETKEVEI